MDKELDEKLPIEVPVHVPDGASIIVNTERASSMSWYPELFDAVKPKGEWDYKKQNRAYAEWGNYNFGHVTTAAAVPEWLARRLAGVAQCIAGTSPEDSGSIFEYPYMDDPPDQEAIGTGIVTQRAMSESSFSDSGFWNEYEGISSRDTGPREFRLFEPSNDSETVSVSTHLDSSDSKMHLD